MTVMDPVLRIPWPDAALPALEEVTREEDPTSPFVTREWLVTNGLGGYASGTVATFATRRYHGLLVAALPAPLGRTMLLAHLAEVVRLPDGRSFPLVGRLAEFRLELGLPVWHYVIEGIALERRVWMEHGRNTVFTSYACVGGAASVDLDVEPWIRFRPHDAELDRPTGREYAMQVVGDRYEISSEGTRRYAWASTDHRAGSRRIKSGFGTCSTSSSAPAATMRSENCIAPASFASRSRPGRR